MTLSKLKKILAVLGLSFIILLSATGSSLAESNPAPATQTVAPIEEKSDTSNTLLQYGPVGGILSVVIGGAIMILKAVNEGKTINVQHYKDRAEQADSEAAGDMKKLRDQMNTMEAKLDEVLADRDELRETLENRKAQFSKDLLAMEKRHQTQLEDSHAVMLQQLNIRHKLERLLVENGIEVPNLSPPPSQEPPTPVH